MAKASVGECKIVIPFSDPSWPERLPLCFGYESETSRLPQRRHCDPEFHSEHVGRGTLAQQIDPARKDTGQHVEGEGDKECYRLLNKMIAFLYLDRSIYAMRPYRVAEYNGSGGNFASKRLH